jgi:hypothetical protein
VTAARITAAAMNMNMGIDIVDASTLPFYGFLPLVFPKFPRITAPRAS